MTSLEPGSQIRSATRQIRSMMNVGVLTEAELDRLLRQIERGIEIDYPAPPPPLEAHPVPALRGRRFEVIPGDKL